MNLVLYKFLFPAPSPPHLGLEDEPNPHLIFLPREKAPIPCMLYLKEDAEHFLLYVHGNGCDIGSMEPELKDYANNFNAHVLMVEFDGYSICPGSPTESSVDQNVHIAYNFITATLRWPFSRVILFGRSIGTGPSARLAAELCEANRAPRLLILQSPYRSIKAVVKNLLGTWGSMACATFLDVWKSESAVKTVTCPLLLVHGQQDELIPATNSEVLFERCPSQFKRLALSPTADHNSWNDLADLYQPARQFMAELPPSASAPTPLADLEAKLAELSVRSVPDSIRQHYVRLVAELRGEKPNPIQRSFAWSKASVASLKESLSSSSKQPEEEV